MYFGDDPSELTVLMVFIQSLMIEILTERNTRNLSFFKRIKAS